MPGRVSGVLPGCLADTVRVVAGRTTRHGDATPRLAGAIVGTLSDTAGQPIRAGEVEVASQGSFGFAQVRQDGSFLARGLDTGDYQICARTYTIGGGAQATCRHSSVPVERPYVTRGIDFTFQAGGTVTATVRDHDGHPVAGVNAVLLSACGRGDFCEAVPAFDAQRQVVPSGSWITDGRGTVTFRNVLPGTYAVCALGYHAATATDTSPTGYADTCTGPGFTVEVAVGTTARVRQTLLPGGVVTGVVTDANGNPLRDAVVHVTGSPADDVPSTFNTTAPIEQNITGTDGSVTIRGVRPGTAQVCVDATDAAGGTSAGGYLDQCSATDLTVAAGQTTTFDPIALRPGGAITGHVLDTAGKPVGDVYVFTSGGRVEVPEVFSDPDGSYRIDRLPTGTYTVCFEPSRRYSARCYDHVPWDDRRPPPSTTTKIAVVVGTAVSGIDAALQPG